ENCSVSTILLSVFEALASRYTGSKDIVIGLPTAYRSLPEAKGAIGNFCNLLVLRTDLSGDPAFREILRRVQAERVDAQSHDDFPFERLVEELNPPRDLSYHPVVQITFAVEEKEPVPQPANLAITPLDLEEHRSQFDLALKLHRGAQGL